MASPFVAEIRPFCFNFAPKGWALCNGQLFPISQNTALFSLLGWTYGGDGQTTFALPNLQGRVPMHAGQGPGLSLRNLGEAGGTETVTLAQMPAHSHSFSGTSGAADSRNPGPGSAYARSTNAQGATGGNYYALGTSPGTGPLNAATVAPSGGGQPHNNMQPYLTINWCIALQGIFPPRN
jgi:microcystin-dependent protein